MFRQYSKVAVFLPVMFALMVPMANSAELVVYFPMEENASPIIDTVAGRTAEEADGSGQLYSQPGPPGFGSAIALTEDGAWNLDADESAALRDLENDFTVAAWVYVDSNVAAEKVVEDVVGSHRILGDNNAWDGDGWGWGVHRDGRLIFTKNGIIDASTFNTYVNEDEWTHVAVTVSVDDGLTFYVNGEVAEDVLDFADINPSPGQNGIDDWWGIGRTNQDSGDQWFAGSLDEVRVYSDLLTSGEIAALLIPGPSVALQAGDADMDFDFDQLDLVKVQIAAKYLTGQPATWGEGDWDGAPGGEPGNPPQGNGVFDQLDIIAALAPSLYLTGPYNAIVKGGRENDEQTSVVYDARTGEVKVNAPASTELTSINIDSAAAIFTGAAAQNLGGSFDNDADNNVFKATFGGSFGSLNFGPVAQAGSSEDFVASDLTVVGSLAGGGSLGQVDLVYVPVPEPATMLLLLMGAAIAARLLRQSAKPVATSVSASVREMH